MSEFDAVLTDDSGDGNPRPDLAAIVYAIDGGLSIDVEGYGEGESVVAMCVQDGRLKLVITGRDENQTIDL